jgi:hypothetical protein
VVWLVPRRGINEERRGPGKRTPATHERAREPTGGRAANADRLALLQREADYAVAETRARLASLQLELAEREATVKSLLAEQSVMDTSLASSQQQLRRLRTADSAVPRNGRAKRNPTEVSR